MMRQLLVFALARIRGLHVVEADDGVDALRRLSNRKFDLLITDINMPIMDGLKLVAHVRNDAQHKHMPVVVVSAHEERDRAGKLGADAFITKPIQAPEVVRTIKRLLELA